MNLYFKKTIILSLTALFSVLSVSAQAPASYYVNADGAKGAALKTAMSSIIKSHTTISYDGLYDVYKESDRRPDGKVWDFYSNTTNYVFDRDEAGNYKKEGDCYNREHSVPQSWFDEKSPMKSDAFHVVPTDGYVNNRRSNYPYGETDGATYKSNNSFSKLGSCTTTGYSGTVFEPNDEYKGDFARIYFYMVTCYESQCTSWGGTFASSKYPGLDEWQLNMLLRWAKNDPVSQKEIDRNNAVYSHQKNRNPYVDYPGLEQYVWGSMKETAFSYDSYEVPTGYGEWTPDGGGSGGEEPGEEPGDEPTGYSYALVTSSSSLAPGNKIIIVYESGNVAMAEQNSNNRAQVAVTIKDHKIATLPEKAQVITLEGSDGAWYFNVGNGYLYAASSSSNHLKTETSADANAKAKITIADNGAATIKFQGSNSRNLLKYNSSASIFSCYESGQQSVQIYKDCTTTDITVPSLCPAGDDDNAIYNIAGQRVDNSYKGVIIRNGRKYIRR